MTTFLFVLKLAAGLLSGVVTIVALFRSKAFEEVEIPSPIIGGPTRRRRQVTFEGKMSAILIVVLICISLVAQTLEQAINNAKNGESQRNTSAQLKKAEEEIALTHAAIDQIEHVVTRFQDCSVFTSVEIDASSFNLEGLVPQSVISATVTSNIVESMTPETNGQGGTTSFGPVLGLFNTNGSLVAVTYEESLTGVNAAMDISLESLESHRRTSTPAKSQSKNLLNFLKSPKSTLSIWREDSDLDGDPDFMGTSDSVTYFKLEYLYPCNRIRASWEARFPQPRWRSSSRVTSLADIGNAYITIALDNFPMQRVMITNAALPSGMAALTWSFGPNYLDYRVMPPAKKEFGGLLPPQPSNLRLAGLSTNSQVAVGQAFASAVNPVAVTLVFNSIPITGTLEPWKTNDIWWIRARLPKKEDFIGTVPGMH